PAIVAKAALKEPDGRPRTYTVRKGDTLYGIALEHGLDYRELAAWNNIENPSRIRVGQQLRVAPPEEAVVVTPARPASGVEVRPLGPSSAPAESPKPLAEAPQAAAAEATPGQGLKTGPKALKLPYSEQNLALIQRAAAMPAAKTEAAKPEAPARVEAPAAETPPRAPAAAEESGDEESMAFGWPTRGRIIAEYTEASKGVDIGGSAGQPILASAAGKVVYSGSGLRGYGKLIIIKHSKTYLTAYAHNDQLLVKEGQSVTRGQKIAEMGSTDSDRVKLHFEIRRYGKPVDPLKYLPGPS
ncbi:MAG TPA: peptidoglycan DD-metalloendopeptidase family protein, partial [Burkholderiales bacterium]